MKYKLRILIILAVLIQAIIIVWIVLKKNSLENEPATLKTFFSNNNTKWVDATLGKMTLEQKIGQLIMVEVNTSLPDCRDSLTYWINNFHIGGIQFVKTSVSTQIDYVNYCHSITQIPLFISNKNIGVDKESLPAALSVSTTGSDNLCENYIDLIVERSVKSGINVCFIPAIDEPLKDSGNEHSRHIKECSLNNALQLAQKLGNRGIISCVSYFNDYYEFNDDTVSPDNNTIFYKKDRYDKRVPIQFKDSILFPFQKSFDKGIPSILIDKNINFNKDYSDLTLNHLEDYLDKYTGFEGLIFSEILTQGYDSRTRIGKTIHSGVDVFIFTKKITGTFAIFKGLLELGILSEKELDRRVRKVLMAKAWMKIEYPKPTDNLKKKAFLFS